MYKKWPRDINIYTFYMIAFFLYKYLPVNVITVNLLKDQKTTKWLKNIEKNNYLSLLGSFLFQKQPHTPQIQGTIK